MLCQTIQNLDAGRDKEFIEGPQTKAKETREQLQRLKPQITQHTNAGHLLAELERKRAAALQKKMEQEDIVTAAQSEMGRQGEIATKLEAEFVDDQEVKDMFASAAWKRYHDKVREKGVDTLRQATKGDKRNLLEQLRAAGKQKGGPDFRFYFANITSYGDKAKDQIKAWSRARALKEPSISCSTGKHLSEPEGFEERAPHLVGFVEHHMLGPKPTEVNKGLRKQGWRGDFVRAQPTINGGRQGHGGVAVFSRSHLHTTVPTTEEKPMFPEVLPPLQ
ncbi:unnamed protein product, partial [Prorocentrum cordatum]